MFVDKQNAFDERRSSGVDGGCFYRNMLITRKYALYYL